MRAGRRNLTSGDEPNAFRIARAIPTIGVPITSLQKDSTFVLNSDYRPTPHSAFSRVAPDFQPAQAHPFEPASWLVAPDLSSATFSAHDFLQRVLSERYERTSRPTHLPVLGDSFDADAALAALDTVESALRRQREVAKHDEEVARDELRRALHLSAKKREHLTRAADAVSTNISKFGDAGRQSASALTSDVSVLKATADQMASLQDARDLVSLLSTESSELDAVRVSRLLSKARQYIDDGSLANLLSSEDMRAAQDEIAHCEDELSLSIELWMRNAIDSGNSQIVRECATAAEELSISQGFIDSYISHIFALDHPDPPGKIRARMGLENVSSLEMLQKFRVVCWETVNSVGEIIPTVCESFSSPSQTLISVLRMLTQRKIVPVAEKIISTLLSRVTLASPLDNYRAEDSSLSDLSTTQTAHGPVEAFRNLAVSDEKERWRDRAGRAVAERREFLVACTEVFRAMAKLKAELLTQCSIPSVDSVGELLDRGPDPFRTFANKWVTEYLRCEKAWIDQQFGTAFFDITRVEAHAHRLAPRQASDAAAYHRYRAFYAQISSRYHQMTRNAIESTHESLCRAASVLGPTVASQETSENEFPSTKAKPSPFLTHDVQALPSRQSESAIGMKSARRQISFTDDVHESLTSKCETARSPQTAPNVTQALRAILDALVMCYLANSETILQAAGHLLPMSESDKKLQELWVSGVSPLTAYMQAIEVLARSNELLDEFLLTLEPSDHVPELSSQSMASEKDLNTLLPQGTRELLHRELTTGLSDLGMEAQVGVRAAVASLRAHLFSMLSTQDTKRAYKSLDPCDGTINETDQSSAHSGLGIDVEASPAFMTASTFIEQQLQSVLSSIHSGNREFVVSELSLITKEAVLHCWCSCEGQISVAGALQLVADGRAMARVFRNHRETASAVECLPAVGQLFLESADDLWRCVESKSLADIEARTLVQLLQKREDHHCERVVKVCQSLGATLGAL